MDYMKFYCPSKVNIYLKILDKRGDGYHNIDSIFLPLKNPRDEMEIKRCTGTGIKIECNIKELEKENILFKVYEEFGRSFGLWPGVIVKLKKVIPMGAGLGGGSSNAACLLRYLCVENNIGLHRVEVLDIAKKCGADVPFFFKATQCIVEGIGDIVEEVDLNFDDYYIIVICPNIHISTSWAYEKLDEKRISEGFHYLTIKNIDIKNSPRLLGHMWFNDFEDIVYRKYPELLRIKAITYRLGAKACVLSGSGSALVGLFSRQISLDVIKRTFLREDVQLFIN